MSIDFKSISSIKINDTEITKITRKTDNVVLWEAVKGTEIDSTKWKNQSFGTSMYYYATDVYLTYMSFRTPDLYNKIRFIIPSQTIQVPSSNVVQHIWDNGFGFGVCSPTDIVPVSSRFAKAVNNIDNKHITYTRGTDYNTYTITEQIITEYVNIWWDEELKGKSLSIGAVSKYGIDTTSATTIILKGMKIYYQLIKE